MTPRYAAARAEVAAAEFWRRWEIDGGHERVAARARAYAALSGVALARYRFNPVAWARDFGATRG